MGSRKFMMGIVWALLWGGTPVVAMSAETDKVLRQLDENLEKRSVYEKEKSAQLSVQQEHERAAADDETLFAALQEGFNAYSSYKYDSAYVYAERCIALAKKINNPDYILQARVSLTFCLLSGGLYKEAFDVMNQIDPQKLSRQSKKTYFWMMVRLYDDIADYNQAVSYQSAYFKKGGEYTDSLLRYIDPSSSFVVYVKAMRQMKEYRYSESIETFKKYLTLPYDSEMMLTEKRLRAIVTSCIGFCHSFQGEEDEAISYLAQSAMLDNETVTRETTALCSLAGILYKRGDVERATRYIHLSLDDANDYNARHRKIQIGDLLPIIEQDRYNSLKQQRNLMFLTMGLALLVLALLAGAYWLIRKKNTKLNEAHEQLDQINKRLHDVNEDLLQVNEVLKSQNLKLSEADRIKDGYIGRTFYINSAYISKLEKLFKKIDRKIAARQYDDLRSSLKESTLNEERENMYTVFDDTFLKLFPNFVQEYNSLFNESDRRLPPDEHSLTNEMRIFALIRLGIDDSDRIANFLNYSVHTVNTYKTRVKNKAIVDNDQFEKLILEI